MTRKKDVLIASNSAEMALREAKPQRPKKPKKPAEQLAIVPMVAIRSFLVGKVFTYEGKTYTKVNILPPDNTNRCLLCEERDGGLYPVPGAILDLAQDTMVNA